MGHVISVKKTVPVMISKSLSVKELTTVGHTDNQIFIAEGTAHY